MPRPTPSTALETLRVLDLTRVRAGPTCARIFADFGADVIKIESPPGLDPNENMSGPRHGYDMQNLHRNKRSLTLNLKKEPARAILRRLITGADLLVENFRPDVKERLGLDFETLHALNPRLILVSISGFGQSGPYRLRAGFDQIAQGMGGMMSVTGLPGQGPVRAGIAVADSAAGLYGAIGALVALQERAVSGKGQWVQTSLLESQIAMLDFQAAQWLIDRKVPGQNGNEHPLTVPTGVFRTKDGHLNVAAIGQTMWVRLCEALEVPQLVYEPGFESDPQRVKHRDRVNAAIGEVFAQRSTAEWTERLLQVGVPCGPIHRVDEVFADPQVRQLGIEWPMHHPQLGEVSLVGTPFRLSAHPRESEPRPAPHQGDQTDSILHELGYGDDRIAELRAAFVV